MLDTKKEYIGFLISIFIALLMLTGCAETKRKTSINTTEEQRCDSIVEYRRTHQHKYSMNYAVAKFYMMHDPDCPLCRETRKREVIAIVDSMLRERKED